MVDGETGYDDIKRGVGGYDVEPGGVGIVNR